MYHCFAGTGSDQINTRRPVSIGALKLTRTALAKKRLNYNTKVVNEEFNLKVFYDNYFFWAN